MRTLALLLLAATLAQPATGQPRPVPNISTIGGTIAGPLQPLTVPPGATLSLRLVDESGARPKITAQHVEETGGRQFPLVFSLPYDVDAIVPSGRYRIRVDLYDASDRRLWSNAKDQTGPFVRFNANGTPVSPSEFIGPVDASAEPVGPSTVRAPSPTAAPRADAPPFSPPPVPAPPRPPETVERTARSIRSTRWQLTEATASAGLDAAALTPYTLKFRRSPLFSGTTACRSFTGTYSAEDGGAIAIGPTATGIERCDPTPEDAIVERLLAGVTRFESTWMTLTLEGDAGTLRFTRTELPDGMAVSWRNGLSEFVCGSAGPVRVQYGELDVQLWLSDALAERQAATGRVGIYHVLPRVLEPGPIRYADGPLGIETNGHDSAQLSLGDERFACTPAAPVPGRISDADFYVSSDDPTVWVHSDGRGRATVGLYDGGTDVRMMTDVTTPEAGRTVYRGPFGFTLTTVEDGCDGQDSTRAVVSQPERTYEVCIPARP